MCATASLGTAEPLSATAATARTWLLLEQPGPWGAHALTDSRLDPRTGRALEQAAEGTGVRVALIRRPGRLTARDGATARRVFLAHTAPGRSWIRTAEVTDPEELLALDFRALGAGAAPGAEAADRAGDRDGNRPGDQRRNVPGAFGRGAGGYDPLTAQEGSTQQDSPRGDGGAPAPPNTPSSTPPSTPSAPPVHASARSSDSGWLPYDGAPLALVCTNGKRDRCCALLGRPLAVELAAGAANVWETTHLGGHRFSPTLLVLPYGYVYGRVGAHTVKGILESTQDGRITMTGCRGRSTWDRPGQAADLAVRQHTGEDAADALTISHIHQHPGTPAPTWTVTVAHRHTSRTWQVTVTQTTATPPTPPSCGATAAAQPRLEVTEVVTESTVARA